MVRATAKVALERYGYTVLMANEGRSGVETNPRRECCRSGGPPEASAFWNKKLTKPAENAHATSGSPAESCSLKFGLRDTQDA